MSHISSTRMNRRHSYIPAAAPSSPIRNVIPTTHSSFSQLLAQSRTSNQLTSILKYIHPRVAPNASQSNQEQQPTTTTATTPSSLTYTSFEGNCWRAQFSSSNLTILVDPWLTGPLTFGGLDFIYSGTKRISPDIDAIASETDLILLTMSIDDHAHRPTLKRLPKSIPVVASPSAAAVAKELGFQNITTLKHGEQTTIEGGGEEGGGRMMTIQATVGALVGPPWSTRENGFILRETMPGGVSLYYEPHCDYVLDSIKNALAQGGEEGGGVDVVVTPPSTQSLLGAYDLVKGNTDNIVLLKTLKPKVVVPLLNAEFDSTGPLAAVIVETGGVEELAKAMGCVEELKGVKVMIPMAAQPLSIKL